MLISRLTVPSLVTALLVSAVCAAAQEYPTKPLRIIAPPPGGSGDVVARLVAQQLSASLGQPVIVDNRPGVLAIDTALRAAPDGYNLLLYGGPLWLMPLMEKTAYDPVKDFAPVVLIGQSPNVLVVPAMLPIKNASELIALAKAKPAELNYAATAPGSSSHLGGELFSAMAGVRTVRINYKGTGAALVGLVGGETQLMIASAAGVAPFIKSGKLRGLAVTTREPTELAPGLPTLSATALPGYECVSFDGMWVPAGSPGAAIARLNREITQTLKVAEVKNKLFNIGSDTVGGSPGDFAKKISFEMQKWGKVIKSASLDTR